MYFGDHPDGFYFSAARHAEPEELEEDYSVGGSDLRLEWDEFGGPLWSTEDGPLPDDPEWLHRALGLSDSLIADLLQWQDDMGAPRQRHPQQTLDERGELLAVRLQSEVGSRFKVRYHR